MIVEWTRGHILIQLGNKSVTVYGEALNAQHGGVSYVVYLNSIRNYNAPYEKESIKESDKKRIISIIDAYAASKKMKIEYE